MRAGTGPRGWGAGGVAGGACFSRRRCRRREPLVRHWVVLQRMRSRVVRAWTICTARRSPGWVRWRFCMVGLDVGIEAGGISPEISPAWAVYTAGGISTSAIINSIPDVRSATFKGCSPVGWAKHGAPVSWSVLQGGKTGAQKWGLPKQTPELIPALKPLFWPLAVWPSLLASVPAWLSPSRRIPA